MIVGDLLQDYATLPVFGGFGPHGELPNSPCLLQKVGKPDDGEEWGVYSS